MKKEDIIQAVIELKETCNKYSNCYDCEFYDIADNSDCCLVKNTDERPKHWNINKHIDRSSARYRQIKMSIKTNRYIFSADDVIGEYENYCNGRYIGENMKTIIESNESAIRTLLGLED